ncbi:CoA-binding protein, partial [Candidatus Bathyarchaeota archaeon]|nr:CoA-binding protein [Candidatus Bathyarchaeota archaeon]
MEQSVKQMHAFFNPRSVAVIGASRKINKAGHVIFKNFADNKRRGVFEGEIYPVNPHEDSILGFDSYPSIIKVPGELELVVIVVPAKHVIDVMKHAAAKRVKA